MRFQQLGDRVLQSSVSDLLHLHALTVNGDGVGWMGTTSSRRTYGEDTSSDDDGLISGECHLKERFPDQPVP
ncbi:MAG: hypothetical protein M1830_004220, partial [Pleopsidium flavum]